MVLEKKYVLRLGSTTYILDEGVGRISWIDSTTWFLYGEEQMMEAIEFFTHALACKKAFVKDGSKW